MMPQPLKFFELQQDLNRLNNQIVVLERAYKMLGLEFHLAPIAGRNVACQHWPESARHAYEVQDGRIPTMLAEIRSLEGFAKNLQGAIDHMQALSADFYLLHAQQFLHNLQQNKTLLYHFSVDLIGLEDNSGAQNGQPADPRSEFQPEQAMTIDPNANLLDAEGEIFYEYFLTDVKVDVPPSDVVPADEDLIVEETTTGYRHRLDKISKMTLEQHKQFVAWATELSECRHALKHGLISTDAEGNISSDQLVKYAFGKFDHVRVHIFCNRDSEAEAETDDEDKGEAEDGQSEAQRLLGEAAAVQFL
ncbi:hypothetical protein Q7P37_009479 [Cladosporium fusiforme]